jgi:NAD(P)H-hydrate epimerase
VIALDVPSGVDATSGEAPGAAISAATTLTLALPKTGLDTHRVGELWLTDIGIPEGVFLRAGVEVPSGVFSGSDRVRLMVPGIREGL